MSIIAWVVLGAIVGLAANRLARGPFPGGVGGSLAGGAAGAFLGGAVFTLIADRGVSGLDAASLLVAAVGATLLLVAVRRAGYVEPRPY